MEGVYDMPVARSYPRLLVLALVLVAALAAGGIAETQDAGREYPH